VGAVAEKAKRIPHGTYNGYINFGCRCKPCSGAWATYMRDWRAKDKERRLYSNMPLVNGKRRVRTSAPA
jgi:hypothetical protein